MATNTNPIAMDGDATTATKNYIIGLYATTEKTQTELNQANALLTEAQSSADFAQNYYNEAQAELQVTESIYADATDALNAITKLDKFFAARLIQANDATAKIEAAAQQVYGSTLTMGLAAEKVEYCLNLANGYNDNYTGTDGSSQYSDKTFLNDYEEVVKQATTTLASMITASENTFTAMSDVLQLQYMAGYLNAGMQQASNMIKAIYQNAQQARNTANQTFLIAKAANTDAQHKLANAQKRVDNLNLQLTLQQAELNTAQQGAAGVSAKSSSGSGS